MCNISTAQGSLPNSRDSKRNNCHLVVSQYYWEILFYTAFTFHRGSYNSIPGKTGIEFVAEFTSNNNIKNLLEIDLTAWWATIITLI